ncbi:hypothetical protein [Streptomyces sp. NPDC101455]|uniref:hypothetical protein n=1 Tax=Streptomyces sp. NPDC101455 TaxID=3366142 RepID=UPI00382A506C
MCDVVADEISVLGELFTTANLDDAARRPAVANADRARLITVRRTQSGSLPRAAAPHEHTVADDTLITHYSDGRGQVLLNLQLGHTADGVLHRDAAV